MPECSYHYVGKEIVQIETWRHAPDVGVGADGMQWNHCALGSGEFTCFLVESFEATLPTGAQTSLEPEGRIRNVRPWWWDVVGVGACCKIL